MVVAKMKHHNAGSQDPTAEANCGTYGTDVYYLWEDELRSVVQPPKNRFSDLESAHVLGSVDWMDNYTCLNCPVLAIHQNLILTHSLWIVTHHDKIAEKHQFYPTNTKNITDGKPIYQ